MRRCNAVGVRVYIDAVINHMSGNWGTGTGTGGSYFDSGALDYQGVPYSSSDFNGRNECPSGSGDIESYQDVNQVCIGKYCTINYNRIYNLDLIGKLKKPTHDEFFQLFK